MVPLALFEDDKNSQLSIFVGILRFSDRRGRRVRSSLDSQFRRCIQAKGARHLRRFAPQISNSLEAVRALKRRERAPQLHSFGFARVA
jgi:5S rRNA maturation endonuclease (ribonuclease M5)